MATEEWCGREDSNFHGSYPTATSTLRVYQFRHDRPLRECAAFSQPKRPEQGAEQKGARKIGEPPAAPSLADGEAGQRRGCRGHGQRHGHNHEHAHGAACRVRTASAEQALPLPRVDGRSSSGAGPKARCASERRRAPGRERASSNRTEGVDSRDHSPNNPSQHHALRWRARSAGPACGQPSAASNMHLTWVTSGVARPCSAAGTRGQ